MATPFRPNSYSLILATAAQTARALSVIKLFKAGVINPLDPSVVVADLDAAEADYDDYAPITITAWLDPVAAVTGGWQITAPTSQFTCAADQVTSNMIGGFWIELAGGDVFLVRGFDAPAVMSLAGNFVQVTPTEIFGSGT